MNGIMSSIIVLIIVFGIPISALVRFIGCMFSSELRKKVKQHPVLHTIWAVVAVLFIALIVLSSLVTFYPPGRVSKVLCANNIKILLSALDDYKSHNNGEYPESLSSLFPKYVKNVLPEYWNENKGLKEDMIYKCIAFKGKGSPLNPPYIYIKPAPDASPDTVVIIDKNHKDAEIVGCKSGNVRAVPHF